MGWGVLFMGIGGEFVLTLGGLTEKAISHWLRFQELARHDRRELEETRGQGFDHVLNNARGVPAVLIN